MPRPAERCGSEACNGRTGSPTLHPMNWCRSRRRRTHASAFRAAVVALMVLAASGGPSRSWAQDIAATEIKTSPLQANLYLLQGYGGNVLLSIGTDGAL